MLLAVHYQVMEHVGSLESTQEVRVALGYRLRQLLRFLILSTLTYTEFDCAALLAML